MSDTTRAEEFQRRAAALEYRHKANSNRAGAASLAPDFRENIKYPARIVGAFAVGLFAVVVSRYVRYHLNGGTLNGEDADFAMILDGGMAAICGFALRQLFRFEAKVFLISFNAGVWAMIVTMHNLIHLWPAPFNLAFSPDWVAAVLAETEPKSIIFMGETYVLGEAAAQGSGSAGSGGAATGCARDIQRNLSNGAFVKASPGSDPC